MSVADEHLASEISLRVLALHREVTRVAQDRRTHQVMLATPAGEMHSIALRMVGELLRAAGYPIVMLGADIPADALFACVRRHRSDVVCVSATMPGMSSLMCRAIDQIHRAIPCIEFVMAGWSLSAAARSRPGGRGLPARVRGGRGSRRQRQTRPGELGRQRDDGTRGSVEPHQRTRVRLPRMIRTDPGRRPPLGTRRRTASFRMG
jgi:hypothetical protein